MLWITRDRRTAFAVSAEILTRIEAETADIPDRTSAPASVFRSMRLSRVFDHRYAMPARYLHDRIHVGRLPEEMNRNDRFRSRRNDRFEGPRIHRVVLRIDVDEHRLCSRVLDRGHRRHEGERHSDH